MICSSDLTNDITIEIQTASFRSVRGYTLIAALLDELAFWPYDDAASPDTETIAAIRPAMASVRGARLLCASTPYAKRGAVWNAYKRHYGQPSSALVWKADTRSMNPTIPAEEVAEAEEEDPAKAAAEYGAQFREDVAGFLDGSGFEPLCRGDGSRVAFQYRTDRRRAFRSLAKI